MSDTTLLFQLREAARTEADELIKFNLKMIADELDSAIVKFALSATADNLQKVNGHWSHGVRMLDFAGKRPGNGGRGGAFKEGALLAAAA